MDQHWNETYKNMWDERYKEEHYAYGKAPNVFFKEWLQQFKPGSILMPADGEGRNGVYAAQLGWAVTSCDLSTTGKEKALQLAAERQVNINYLVGDLEQLSFAEGSFDAIGLIYAHFDAARKSLLHRKLNSWLKPGGLVILEAFSKAHIHLNSLDSKIGGPKDVDMLLSEAEIKTDFENYEPLLLTEEEVLLAEGLHHMGKGAVVRFVGRKPE